MPSRIVKLSSSDARAWTHNQPVWLDESGDIARAVTREEQHAISRALQQSQKINQSFRAELTLFPLNHTGRRTTTLKRNAPVPKLDAAFEINWVGEARVVTVWNGTRRYATGREVLAARLLADHGECVLHGRNGKCIGVLRDPLIRERPYVEGRRVQWSRNPDDPRKNESERSELTAAAGLDRRGARRGPPLPRKRKRHALTERQASMQHRHPQSHGRPQPSRRGPQPEIAPHSPQRCPNDCRGLKGGQAWAHATSAAPLGAQDHHPLCQHAKAWAATLEKVEVREVLFDLESRVVRRPAFDDEIKEADAAEAAGNARAVTIADRVYAVLSPEDAEAAAQEAVASEAAPDEREPWGDGPGPLPSDDAPVGARVDGAPVGGVVDTEAPPEGRSTADDRGAWPSLEQLKPRHATTHRDSVTARDYLLRTGGSEGRP